jgi:threonine dehydratase
LIPLEQIRAARERIAGKVVRTPLLRLASERPAIYLKLENLQPIGSFKLRGALNAIVQLPTAELQAGVITASAGNMG